MVEESSQVNPVDPYPGLDAASPWPSNGSSPTAIATEAEPTGEASLVADEAAAAEPVAGAEPGAEAAAAPFEDATLSPRSTTDRHSRRASPRR